MAKLDNRTLWNEAATGGLFFGAISVGCLLLKELSVLSGSTFLITAAGIVLWVVEFFGCILLMKRLMIRLKDKYETATINDAYRFGRRAALLSGLILASAQAYFILQMPPEELENTMSQVAGAMSFTSAQQDSVAGMLNRLPLFTFLFQWLYCYLYGCILASIMSRYVFIQKLFDNTPGPDNGPDEQ